MALLKFKAESGVSDMHFTNLLELFADALTDNNVLPTTTKEAKKVVCPWDWRYKRYTLVLMIVSCIATIIKICVTVPHAMPHATSVRLQKTRTSRMMKSIEEFHSRLCGTFL